MTNSIKLISLRSTLILFSIITITTLKAQNYLTVPFSNGFVGDNSGSGSASNAYYTNGTAGVGLGWTNIQFAQNSTAAIFTTQGNDIIGMVLITDATGIEKTINGFIKWRTPNGNSPSTMCFQPAVGTNVTLTTNGTNGTSTYIINDTKYIGLTFNGQTLSITGVPGTVTGNAATSGLLDALNTYFATFPKLTIGNVTVNEGTASVNAVVTLSSAPSSDVIINFSLSDSSAVITNDYLASTNQYTYLTFLASQPTILTKTISIPIVNDQTYESTEFFKINLLDPVNASITDGLAVVTITDNDQALPVELTSFSSECKESGVDINWQTATEHNSAHFTVEKSRDGLNWMHLASLEAAGNSSTLINYSYIDAEKSGIAYYRLQQVDQDGTEKTYGPISSSCEAITGLIMKTYPNPCSELFTINIESEVPMATAQIILKDVFGRIVASKAVSIVAGTTQVEFLGLNVESGIYSVSLEENGTAIKTVKQVMH